MKRLWIIVIALLVFFTIGFLLASRAGWLEPELIQALLEGRGPWLVALAIVLLLAGDIVLPTPSSVVMVVSGSFLGTWYGGLVSFIGAMGSALIGYWLCRWGGDRAFRRLIGTGDVVAIRRWFDRYGVYAIVISRPIPMLTEILSCVAGLARFNFRRFLLASTLGTLPICFIYSYAGVHSDLSNPWPAVWVALVIPAVGWLIVRRIKSNPIPEKDAPHA